MGVDAVFYTMVGLKKDYFFLKSYKSISDHDYMFDQIDEDLSRYNNIIFKDYLPDDYITGADGMCGEYSFIGKRLMRPKEYLDEINKIELTPDSLTKLINEVYNELQSLNIKDFTKEDIKFYSFVHFS